MLSGNKTRFIALTDADGCIFNNNWQWLFFYTIVTHHDFFFQYRNHSTMSAGDDAMVKNKIAEIIDEINAAVCHVSGNQFKISGIPTYHDLVLSMLAKLHYPDPTSLAPEALDAILTDIKTRYRQFILQMGQPGQALLAALVMAANKSYFSEIIARLKRDQVTGFHLACGSNRQSYEIDDHNAEENGTGSFIQLLLSLQAHFNHLLSADSVTLQCLLDRFLLSDFYDERESGHSFNLILQQIELESQGRSDQRLEHPQYVFDHTKFTLLYTIAHHFAKRYPDDHLIIAFFDDRDDIHSALAQAFAKHPDLLPHNVVLEGWPYEGNLPELRHENASYRIQGTGPIDINYHENLLHLVIHSGFDETHKPSIDAANECDFAAFKRDRVLTVKLDEVAELASAMAAGFTLFETPAAEIVQEEKQLRDSGKSIKK